MRHLNVSYLSLATLIISELKLRKINQNEHSGPCPYCGGTDRFRIQNYQGDLKHHCRGESRGECSFAKRSEALRLMGLLPKVGGRK